MTQKPIFVATHPRACSTAFERVFMTRTNTLKCVHEPFGDAFYFGAERLGRRYEDDEQARLDSGFSQTNYKTVFDRLDREASEGKRLLIKDMAYYIMPPDRKPVSAAPSLHTVKRGIGTNGATTPNGVTANGTAASNGLSHSNGTTAELENPTVVPVELLDKFHYAFLIRDPHYSIPSYYRCTIPPLDEVTGFFEFFESESGYDEVRRLFDYLRKIRLVGPRHADGWRIANARSTPRGTNGGTNGPAPEGVEICVVDADDMLDNPGGIIERFCNSVGEDYTPEMLSWDTEEEQAVAHAAFEKWPGFHDDALDSDGLNARTHSKQPKPEAQFDEEWRQRYGEKGAQIIRSAVDKSMPDYLYMKKFALRP